MPGTMQGTGAIINSVPEKLQDREREQRQGKRPFQTKVTGTGYRSSLSDLVISWVKT